MPKCFPPDPPGRLPLDINLTAMASVTGNQAASVPAAAPLAAAACGGDASPDFGASFNLRVVTFFVVLTCSSLGIVLPLVLRFRQSLAGISRSSWLFLAKAFGAGVILAVGIIHVFPDASTALGDPCLGARQGTAGSFPKMAFPSTCRLSRATPAPRPARTVLLRAPLHALRCIVTGNICISARA